MHETKNSDLRLRWQALALITVLSLPIVPCHAGVGEGRERPVRTMADGAPVYSYGSTYILGEPPDILTGVKLQEGNSNPIEKIKLLKSWEIEDNMIGGAPAGMPRTELMDRHQNTILPINLIDNDPRTFWSSWGNNRPDQREEWIRIDLAVETPIKSIVLVQRSPGGVSYNVPTTDTSLIKVGLGDGLPRKLKVKLSRDAWHWNTIAEHDNFVGPSDNTGRISFDAGGQPAKQIWIQGDGLPMVSQFPYARGFSFSLVGVEVLDQQGNNLALTSRGAGVSVSSTCPTYPESHYTNDSIWETHAELGFKWMRVNGWDTILNWSYVEREPGKFVIDPKADQAVSEMHENGVHVIMSLVYSNWNYTPDEGKIYRSPHEFTDIGRLAPIPTTGIMHEAWLRYVRFMAEHFKGRVEYWCIWNEPQNAGGNYGFGNPKLFADFIRSTVKEIRKVDPDVKFAWPTAYTSGKFIEGCIKEGIAPIFSLVHADLSDPKGIKKRWEDGGFKGKYITYEVGVGDPYPVPPTDNAKSSIPDIGELKKAKIFCDAVVKMTNEGIITEQTEWDMTYNNSMAIGLFRVSSTGDNISPIQPALGYYSFRNMGTLMDAAYPETFQYHMSNNQAGLTVVGFRKRGNPFISVWASGAYDDNFVDRKTDVAFPDVKADRAIAYDSLNGLKQELVVFREGNGTVIKDFLGKDYPVFIELIANGKAQ